MTLEQTTQAYTIHPEAICINSATSGILQCAAARLLVPLLPAPHRVLLWVTLTLKQTILWWSCMSGTTLQMTI
jgi:hypothetical protein